MQRTEDANVLTSMVGAHPENGPLLLVVEDDAFLLMEYEDAISSRGCVVLTAMTLPEALVQVELRPDGAILDIRIGRDMVFPVAARLRELGIPFVFCSGTREDIPPGPYRDVQFHSKPVRPELVLDALLSEVGSACA